MAIPPFPSQDLAKLVLGYLAEEQLMTAYDEFLQASPYLDAMRNEYDRIFMTSLKSILAEYRAVKIFVETCKPVVLRRRLYGCQNLLEVIKFLVQNVDVNKFNPADSSIHRSRSDSRYQVDTRAGVCEVCDTSSCDCKSRFSMQSSAHALDSSVETTSLRDLPGNHVTTRNKQVKVLERESRISQSEPTCNSSSGEVIELSARNQSETTSCLANSSNINPQNVDSILINNATVRPTEAMDSSHKLEEFNNIFNKVCNNSSGQLSTNAPTNDMQPERLSSVSHVGPFKNFTAGVTAPRNDSTVSNVPDSSTSESYCAIAPASRDSKTGNTAGSNVKEVTKAHIFFKLGTVKNTQSLITYPGKKATKPTEQKITILSDIKVDKHVGTDMSPMPEVLRNATSTPLMRMQTILINGTPAFTQVQQNTASQNFTKDEIMAMPTIIIVPNSSSEATSVQSQVHTTAPPTDTILPSVNPLGPLVIDVPNSPRLALNKNQIPEKESDENMALLKAVQGKNFSLPKDTIITTDSTNKKTPQVIPPVRKSCSTPRRTSHVRVLDFATPRRILDQAIMEQGSNVENGTEVVISGSPSLHKFTQPRNTDKHTSELAEDTDSDGDANTARASEISPSTNKSNWDAELRAMAVANNDGFVPVVPICHKRQRKPTAKSKSASSDKKKKTKSKKRKSKEVNVNTATELPVSLNVPVKPTINIVSGSDWNSHDNKTQHDKSNEQNKSNDEPVDTPELDRTSLQNVIGAKLNISELLETPYKQALYDIQMETPRFLGPDLPGEPLSDIKIMNIPTPRFLDSPKQVQGTPSSYNSRPTDYSSGGSYYKPDDNDCVTIEDIGYPKNSAGHTNSKESSEPDKGGVRTRAPSSRPIRKCAKNVSYYNKTEGVVKHKDLKDTVEDKTDAASSCSDSVSVNSSQEFEKQKEIKSAKLKSSRKNNKDKRSTKRKSPAKKDTPKSFMKIKPRRPTPTKDSTRKNMRKTSESKPRKRTSSKENTDSAAPMIFSAPTKSRRKSSTPRKLHCTKAFDTVVDYSQDSPDDSKVKSDIESSKKPILQESNIEQPLKQANDTSQDTEQKSSNTTLNETEDINKIKEFIATSVPGTPGKLERNLHDDLVKRGFDVETARIIERDLLDAPTSTSGTETVDVVNKDSETNAQVTKTEASLEKTSESSTASAKLQIVQDEEDDDEFEERELSVYECNEDSENYIVCNHEETEKIPKTPLAILKDKYCAEICIDDEVSVKIRATPHTLLLDEDPINVDPGDVQMINYSYRETEIAVSSISNIDKLYTPLKDSIKKACYDIFDSTLTSLDTPLKATSPKQIEHETTVSEIILEVEKVEEKEKDAKKRKRRISSEEESNNEAKKTKPEAPYLLNPANIQNIDIESVLYKLHGP